MASGAGKGKPRMRILVQYCKVFLPLLVVVFAVILAVLAFWQITGPNFLMAYALSIAAALVVWLGPRLCGWVRHEVQGRMALAKHQFAAAEEHFRKGLAAAEHYPDDDPRLAILLDGLGQAVKGLGKYSEAESLARQALAINERAWGPDHYRTMVTVVNLANIYLDLARFDEAASLYRRALEQVERRYGPGHRDVGICLNNLGRVFSDRERYAEAESYFRRALEIMEARYRSTHFMVSFMSNNVGFVLAKQGKCDEAEPYAERAVRAFEGRRFA
jgi:tetratricopeptide (TPR) repeat protein